MLKMIMQRGGSPEKFGFESGIVFCHVVVGLYLRDNIVDSRLV